jgi:predicted dehydrogenase
MMQNKLAWGVVGSCGIARRRTIPEGIVTASNARLVGVFDTHQEGNSEVAQTFGATAFPSLEALLAAEIEAIYIATPVYLHHEHVACCVRAGKHVLCEKPLAMSTAEGRDMVALARACKVHLGLAFMMRFHSQHQEALKIIQSGKLGKPVYGRAQLSCWYPPLASAWRQDPGKGGGGSLVDMGVHCIDLLEMFFGPVASVTCHIANLVQDYRSEDSAVATLVFKNGAFGTVDTFFCIPDEGSQNVLELYGSEGSILAKGTIGQGSVGEMFFYSPQRGDGYDVRQARDAGKGIKLSPPPVNMYRAEIEEFSQAVLDGGKSALNAAEGLRSQRILEACYESARTAKTVGIEAQPADENLRLSPTGR